MNAIRKMERDRKTRMVLGVCGAVADYFGVDATVIRLVWVVVTVFTGFVPGVVAYVVAAIIVPEKLD